MPQLLLGVALSKFPFEFVDIKLDLAPRTAEDEVNDLVKAITELLILTE